MADELDETVERQKTYLEELVKQRARTFRWFIYWAGLCGAIFSVALIYYIAAILKSAGAQAPNADAAVATALDPNIAFGTAPYLVDFSHRRANASGTSAGTEYRNSRDPL